MDARSCPSGDFLNLIVPVCRVNPVSLLFYVPILMLTLAWPISVQAQTFAPVAAMSFVKAYAAPDPLPQILTVASVGAGFDLRVTSVTTSSGGGWLSVSGCGSYCATPHALTVTVTTSAAAAAGTYAGQIVLTEYYGRASITVPVTLTIGATGTAFFDNTPGQMSFSLKTGGTAPPAQTIQIRNGGSGALNWTLAASTSDGGAWLSASAASGAAPSAVTVTLLKANLPGGGLAAGTFIGQLLFQTASGNATVPISVVVGDKAFSQVNAISFTKPYGGADPLPQAVTVASTGTAFDMRVIANTATGGNWLTVAGCGAYCDTPQVITASVNPSAALAAGTYTGQIVLTEYYGTMSMTVPVTLTVAGPGSVSFDNLPGQVSFTLKTGGAAPPAQPIEVRNRGTGTLNWTLSGSTADGGNWLTATPGSGSAPSQVSIAITPGNLPGAGLIAGTFVGQLVFQTSGNSVTVPVSVVVGANVFRQVNAISFVKAYGGADPLPQMVTAASTGTAFDFKVAAFTATGGNWLSVSGCGAYCDTPQVITVSVNPSAALAAGTYTGQVVFTEYYGGMAITVPVTLTVGAAGTNFFDNLPGQLSFSMQPGGANPSSQGFQIRNIGPASLAWSVTANTSDSGSWLTTTPAGGTTPATITVGIVATALPGNGLIAGTYTGELVFQSTSGSVSVPVAVVVASSTFIQSPALSFAKPAGGANPVPQTFTVTNAGTAFDFRANGYTGNGGAWFTVSGCGAYCAPPRAITVTVNADPALPVGTYTGELVLTEYYYSMAQTIPVTLTVTGAGPAAPTLVSPSNGATGVPVTTALSWNAVSGADSYDVYLGTSVSPPFVGNTGTTSYTASALNQNTPYFWRVVAKNSFGIASSSTFSFTTTCTYTVGPATSAVSPAGGPGMFTVTTQAGCTVPATSNALWLTIGAVTANSVGYVAAANTTGVQRSGTLTIGGQTVEVMQAGNNVLFPALTSLSPFQGTSSTPTFTVVYSDGNGWAALQSVEAIINPRWESPAGGCFIRYNTANRQFTLFADDGVTPAPSFSNSQCTLNIATAAAAFSGNTITLTLPVTFKPTFTGQKHIWMRATDFLNRTTNWLVYGSWIPGQTTVTAIPWYRFFDSLDVPNSYVYTFDKNEYDFWVTHGMRGDGISGLVLNGPLTVAGTTDIAWYRVYVVSTNSHLWTSDRNEFLTIINFQDSYVGEGVAAFAMPYLDEHGIFHDGVRGPAPVTNSIPFHRSAFAGLNLHFWSTDRNELPPGYFYEGIACYIFPASGAVLTSAPGAPVVAAAPEEEPIDDGAPAVVGVVSSASNQRGPVAPGEAVSIAGRHLAGSVLLNGVPAEVISAQENEIRIVVPKELAGAGEAMVEVENGGRRSKPQRVRVVRANPALFASNHFGRGYAQARNENGTPNDAEHPAARGSLVTLFATGAGLLDLPLEAHIAGYPTQIVSVSASATRAGTVEVTVRIPEEVEPGMRRPVYLQVGTAPTQAGVNIAVE